MSRVTLNIFLSLFFLSVCLPVANAQGGGENPVNVILNVDTVLYRKDAAFTRQWDYPWWVIKHKDGHFENTMGDTIMAEDTAHLYHTAYIRTNHQGEHKIRYCRAVLDKDTLTLNFSDLDATYHGWLQVKIVDRAIVSSQWFCRYVMSVPGERITFTTTSQYLSVNTDDFKPGTVLKGQIATTFREDFTAPNHSPESLNYKVSGIFQVSITDKH